ncbi:TonB-linked outer membrane protein, SusC/RagA family [Sinomicrobium oceani]|uniref:TonB-linked outer membrane protein, SusC/RagA family n=1 Tax=Sinomicrobium oceani TaxID=1150368 RepID=A0A1K1RC92_9FLAO|nr:SusC/RagA family TonB-linked outer membrane protein [Sinomicrobium oceani]SFW69278.1 TonB-linked outer membrane protein, SusC/RagA family [Sinomicrobium oceani]
MKKNYRFKPFYGYWHSLAAKIPVGPMIRVMKIYVVLVCLTIGELLASNVRAQNITLRMERQHLSEVLSAIEKRTNYHFFYNSRLVDVSKIVSINIDNAALEETMEKLLTDMEIDFKVVKNQIVLFPKGDTYAVKMIEDLIKEAEEKSARKEIEHVNTLLAETARGLRTAMQDVVRGTVTDEDGIPLPGVNIVVKGSTIGTQTDFDGKYTIAAKQGQVLSFSYVGQKTVDVRVGASGVVDLQMEEDAQALEEVVVVAYGVQDKETMVGSNTSIKSEMIEDRPLTNIAKALDGNVPGVQVATASGQPGSGLSVRIRGVSSYNLSNSPLYILDGAVFTGDLSDLNPNDIESLNVLKDASATSLYGAAAANGVVLITSKKGGKRGKGTFNFNAFTGMVTRGIPQYDRVNADDYYVLTWNSMRNGYLASTSGATIEEANAYASSELISDNLKNNIYNVADDEVVLDGALNPAASKLYNDFDWEDAVTRTGIIQRYDLSYGNTTDTGNFFSSVSYNKEEGYAIRTGFERFTARVSTDRQVTDWLKLGVSLNGNISQSNQAESEGGSSYINPFYFTRGMGPIYSPYLYDAEGNPVYDEEGKRVYDGVETRGRGAGASVGRNVIQETLLNRRYLEANSIMSRVFAEFKLTEDLTFTTNATYDVRNQGYDYYSNKVIGDAYETGALSRTEYKYTGVTLNQLLNYKKSFGQHNFGALIGHESFEYKYDYQYQRKIEQVVNGIYEFSNFLTTTSLNSYDRRLNKESWFARLNYDFDGKYIASLSARNDATSRFSDQENKGTFWSAGLGWNISREDFLSGIKEITFLKFRTSYGQVGNDGGIGADPGWQADLNLYNLGGYFNAGEPGVYYTQVGNRNLTWESNDQFDVGLEFGLLDDRITGSAEYFKRRTKDMIFEIPTPGSAGVPGNGYYDNIGIMQNTGWEFLLNFALVRHQEFRWDLSVSASLYKNKMIELPQEEIINGTKRLAEGRSMYDFWLRNWYGVDPSDGAPLYVQDPEIATDDNTRVMEDGTMVTTDQSNAKYDYAGSAIPDVTGYFTTNFSYKGFYLNTLFTYQLGGKIYDSNYRLLMGSSPEGDALHTDMLKAWKNPGDITDVPVMSTQNVASASALSSRWLSDASYLTLKTATVGYNFTPAQIEGLGISGLKVYLSAENVFSLTDRVGLEPAQSFNGTTTYRYTPSRILALGLNLSF